MEMYGKWKIKNLYEVIGVKPFTVLLYFKCYVSWLILGVIFIIIKIFQKSLKKWIFFMVIIKEY